MKSDFTLPLDKLNDQPVERYKTQQPTPKVDKKSLNVEKSNTTSSREKMKTTKAKP